MEEKKVTEISELGLQKKLTKQECKYLDIEYGYVEVISQALKANIKKSKTRKMSQRKEISDSDDHSAEMKPRKKA